MALDQRLLSLKERPLFRIGVIFSGLCWLGFIVGTFGIGAIYSLFVFAFIAIAQAIFLAHVKGNGVLISERQLPGLYARCVAAAQKLGLQKTPEIYLLQSHGILNAYATRLLSRHFVIIYSSLADSCTDPRQLDFVIGHEIGHLAAGHLAWNTFLLPFHLLPWLGAAYSRAREYTCDRCGLEVVDSIEPATRGLAVLAAGGKYAMELNVGEFSRQREEAGRFWMATRELVSTHPYLCKRIAALHEFVTPGTVPPVARNPLAYPLAPLLGLSAGGASSMVLLTAIYLGVVAAFAFPALRNYTGAARNAAQRIHPSAATPTN